jgi:hypothetical protein
MENLKELSQFLESHFRGEMMAKDQSLVDGSATLEFIKMRLKMALLSLLQHNHQKLLDTLYRIDVSDVATNKAFSAGIPDKVAEELAQAIIDRQLKKLAYRQSTKL